MDDYNPPSPTVPDLGTPHLSFAKMAVLVCLPMCPTQNRCFFFLLILQTPVYLNCATVPDLENPNLSFTKIAGLVCLLMSPTQNPCFGFCSSYKIQYI